jgi:serine/threonine protein kinase
MGLALAPEEIPVCAENWLGLARSFGDYTLERQVGSGGMGVVFEATRHCDGQKVALKLLRDLYAASPAQLRRFGLEAEVVARLDHPNIVHVHEVGEWDGHPFLCMEFIEGPSLSEILRRPSSNPQNGQDSSMDLSDQYRLARFIAKTARAVEHAHERGVLHRDLKPGNILVDAHGEPRLTDFGLAKNPRAHLARRIPFDLDRQWRCARHSRFHVARAGETICPQ